MKWIKWIITCYTCIQLFPLQFLQLTPMRILYVVDTKSLQYPLWPGLTYDVTGSLKKGDQVEVISTSGDWLEIQMATRPGWIASWLTTIRRSVQLRQLQRLFHV